MTVPRRPRTAIPRAGSVRTIDSSNVRYPGLDHPAVPQDYESWRAGGRQLRPVRDTGLAIGGRLSRERRLRERQRRQRAIVAVVAVVVLAALSFAWRHSSDTRAAARLLAANAGTAAAQPRRVSAPDPSVGQLRAIDPASAPTPIFASYGSLKLRLPVRVADLTEVGFHQAAYSYALHLKTPLSKADGSLVKKEKSTHRDLSKQDSGPNATLTGSYVRMWRNRPGKPDSAVDVGATPGSPVIAPVTGTVVKVKRYKLYGLHDDYEIHIQPRGYSKVDAVMIHIADVTVKPGDTVQAGITRIGVVRRLSDRINHQLGEYTRGGGDHTHLQLNDASNPAYKGLDGAIRVGGS